MNNRTFTALVAGLLVGTPIIASAGPVTFWFAAAGDSAGTPITAINAPTVGSTFTVALWYSTTDVHSGVDLFVAYDHSTTEGSAATALDHVLGSGVVSNVNASYTNFGSVTGGGQGSGTRGYGMDTVLVVPPGSGIATPSGAHLLDLTLKNNSLTSGSYTVQINDGGTGSEFTSYVTDFANSSAVRPGGNVNLLVNAVPEPISMSLLGLGLVAIVRRRRSK